MMKLRPTNDSPAVFADPRSVGRGRDDVQYRFGCVVRSGDAPERPSAAIHATDWLEVRSCQERTRDSHARLAAICFR
ncbi:MAG: hypothetical protein QOE42_361 [Chloroflexota bacterium]|jgi:hypothetical protein|nr:hypothetical protein [Chloroflexota bacterium]